MDHARIDEELIVDRYLMGKLPDDLRERFEEHFADCPACVERLEAVEGLRKGLRELPAEAAPAVAPEAPAVFPAPGRTDRWPSAALLPAACLLLGVGLSAVFYLEARRNAADLSGARRALQAAEHRQADLEHALDRARAEALQPPQADRALREAPVAASVFRLNLTRGAGSPEPENRLVVRGAPGSLALLFDRPDRTDVSSYRVVLQTADGRPVGEALAADAAAGGMLAVTVPAKILPPGDYRLGVEAVSPSGGDRLATYGFRVVVR